MQFTATTKAGSKQLTFDNARLFEQHLKQLHGQVVVTIHAANRQATDMQRWKFQNHVVPHFIALANEKGQHMDKAIAAETLVHQVRSGNQQHLIEYLLDTSTDTDNPLTKQEMSQLIDDCQNWINDFFDI